MGCKRSLPLNSGALDSDAYLRPYIDSASWLYLDSTPVLHIASPVMHAQNLKYAMPPPRRKTARHHHHHRERSNHCHRTHRRVNSDPGIRAWSSGPQRRWKHRRVFSFNNEVTGIRRTLNGAIAEASEESQSQDEGPTSTFRKVPWHPNLHMLKIRNT